MGKYILALDQGTTSSRAIIFNKEQEIVQLSQKEFTQIYPQAGWVEHDPGEIWNSQREVILDVLKKSNISKNDISAIGITNQRETALIWDRTTGEPVYNAICWQCTRTSNICNEIMESGFNKYIKDNTGLVVDAYFSATKVKWILDNVEGVRIRAENGDLLFGTIDTWLLWKLTNGEKHLTDYTNASRTMMFNIKTLEWDKEILKYLDIPEAILPKVTNSSTIFGLTDLGFKDDILVPIGGMAGDQQAALFGQKCFNSGDMKNTYGTGCFLLMNTGNKIIESKHGLLTTIGIGINGKIDYALEGSVFVAGAVLQWIRDELGLIKNAEESEIIANSVKDNNGVYIVPAFVGMGAPYWDMYARGGIIGLTRDSNKNHIIRAALESICYQSKDLIVAMENDIGKRCENLRVDGGATKNNFLMQFQADILNTKVIRPYNVETTALGAALLAGLATNYWKNKEEIINTSWENKIFKPLMKKEVINKNYEGWKMAVEKILTK